MHVAFVLTQNLREVILMTSLFMQGILICQYLFWHSLNSPKLERIFPNTVSLRDTKSLIDFHLTFCNAHKTIRCQTNSVIKSWTGTYMYRKIPFFFFYNAFSIFWMPSRHTLLAFKRLKTKSVKSVYLMDYTLCEYSSPTPSSRVKSLDHVEEAL